MKVKIKKLNPNAVIPFKKHKEDFCYDVVATSKEKIAPRTYKYGLGFALQIERDIDYKDGNLILDIDLRPRSSIYKTGMILSNCTGTIDEIYIGEVSAVFYHVIEELQEYNVGDRIGQIKLGFTSPIEFEEVDTLSETERGEGGYGSTGN